MSVLHIAITEGTPDLERRAVEALTAAGLDVYRAWIEPNPIELAEAKERGAECGWSPHDTSPTGEQGSGGTEGRGT